MSVQLEEHKKHLEEIAKLITKEEECALVIAPDKESLFSDLADQKNKTGEKFMVLIVGEFNAGKTSMINAMMGREILPTGDLPETGVITEIVYGKELKITLYPKKGSGLKEPVVLHNPTLDEIKKYCSIDNKGLLEQQTTENVRYERTVVECDLPLLKEGIVLVDSVGLNDPWGNDYITERYFPKADAIIYLMSGLAPYSKDDKQLLTEINDIGLRNLIIAYTRFGLVRNNYRRKPASELQNYMDVVKCHALPHTDIGAKAIHFIDSMDALEAKEDGDTEKLIQSGMDGLEKFCNRYLVEEKGKYKIVSLVGAIESKARELISHATVISENAGRSEADLQEQINNAEAQLEAARITAEGNTAKFENRVEQDKPVYEQAIRNHVYSLADKVDLDGYTLKNGLPRGFSKLVPGKQNKMAEAIAKECTAELERRMKAVNSKWISTQLNEKIKESITASVEDMSDDIEVFYKQLDNVDMALSANQKSEGTKRNIKNILAGVAYTAFTGDYINGGIAIAHGTGALGRAVVSDVLVVGGLYGLASAGVAIAAPVVPLAMIAGNIVAILLSNQTNAEKKIMAETASKYKTVYAQDLAGQEKTSQSIINLYHNKLNEAVANYKKAMDEDLKKKEDVIKDTIKLLGQDADAQALVVSKNNAAIKKLHEIVEKAKAIATAYKG